MVEDQEVKELSIGEIFSKARAKRGISIKDVEKDIKIRSKYLTAIENDDYKQIPGQAYVIGFIKNYADYLQIESQDLIARYQSENEDPAGRSDNFAIGDKGAKKSKLSGKILLMIFLIAITAAIIFILRSTRLF